MRAEIEQAVASKKIDDLARLLAGARSPGIRFAARRVVELSSEEADLQGTAAELADRAEPPLRQLASILCIAAYPEGPEAAFDLLSRLLCDRDAPVRDAAAESCGRLLDAHFGPALVHLAGWLDHPAPTVRRAVLLAATVAAHRSHVERAEPLLRLVAPLLADRDPLVRHAAGPLAVAALLEHYPTPTFEHLIQWSTSSDEQELWNVAMALGSPAAAELAKKALIVLRKLALDPRRYVWRAVATAMWKLGRKRPDVVRPELARWLEGEERVDVARTALTYL